MSIFLHTHVYFQVTYTRHSVLMWCLFVLLAWCTCCLEYSALLFKSLTTSKIGRRLRLLSPGRKINRNEVKLDCDASYTTFAYVLLKSGRGRTWRHGAALRFFETPRAVCGTVTIFDYLYESLLKSLRSLNLGMCSYMWLKRTKTLSLTCKSFLLKLQRTKLL